MGIDSSENMISIARQNIPDARFINLDCTQLQNINGRFDLVISAFLLPYLEKKDVLNLFRDIALLLNKNGLFYLSTIAHNQRVKSSLIPGGDKEEILTYYHSLEDLNDFANKTELEKLFQYNIGNPVYKDPELFERIVCFKKVDKIPVQ